MYKWCIKIYIFFFVDLSKNLDMPKVSKHTSNNQHAKTITTHLVKKKKILVVTETSVEKDLLP